MKRLEKPDKRHLQAILGDMRDGKFVIPEFQREFDWGAKDILELIRSIFEDYYIGTLLFWKVSPENISSLKYEPIYGFEGQSNPNHFVLDGQQRLSAIFYALCSPNKNFPGKKSKCYFFLNIKKLVEGDMEKAFSYEWASKKVDELLDSPERQFESHILPLKIIGDKDMYLWVKWLEKYKEYWSKKGDSECVEIKESVFKIINELLQEYDISFVELDKSLEMSRVCDIFTRINSQGIDLSIFDILNAAFLPKGIELKSEWRKINSQFIKGIDDNKMKVYMLQTISILKQAYCSPKYLYFLIPGSKRKIKEGSKIVEDILINSKEEFLDLWNKTVRDVEMSIKKILNPREFGAIKNKFIPYPTIIPTFTAINLESQKSDYKDIIGNKEKLSRWYWSSIFTQNYSSSVESQSASDFMAMKRWFNNDMNIINVVRQAKNEIKNLDLKKESNQSSAIYKAIFNLMIIRGARDPVTFELPEYSSLDDHHIIPQNSTLGKKLGNKVNTILNRIPISDNTNRNNFKVRLPNKYLKEILDGTRDKKSFYEMLESHFISKEMVDILLKENFSEADFNDFIKKRERLILSEISLLIGADLNIEQQIKDAPDKIYNLYEIEIRKKINEILTEKYGENYWQGSVIPPDIIGKVNENIKSKLKLRPDLKNEFMSDAGKLRNCDVMDYEKIIQKNWNVFETTFGSSEETKNQFKNLQVFRNALKHIDTPSEKDELDELTIKKGELAMLWLEKILGLNKPEEESIFEEEFVDVELLLKKLKEDIHNLGEDMDEIPNRGYFAFKRKIGKNRNFVSIKPLKGELKIYLDLDEIDPKKIGRNMSGLGHTGTGEYEFIVREDSDREYVMGLIKKSYEKQLELLSKNIKDVDFLKEANNHREIMKKAKEELISKYSGWASKISNAKPSFGRWQGKGNPVGNLSCVYLKWKSKTKSVNLEAGLLKEENKPFVFYTALYLGKESKELKERLLQKNIREKLESFGFMNKSKKKTHLWVEKNTNINEINNKNVMELISKDVDSIKPIIEDILTT